MAAEKKSSAEKKERLAAALRANLKRRKTQARTRVEGASVTVPPEKPEKT